MSLYIYIPYIHYILLHAVHTGKSAKKLDGTDGKSLEVGKSIPTLLDSFRQASLLLYQYVQHVVVVVVVVVLQLHT